MKTTSSRPSRPLPCSLGARVPGLALSLVLPLVLPLAVGGCPSPDAQGKYDRFNEQTEEDRERPEMMDTGMPMLPDLGGDPTGTGTGGGGPMLDGVFLMAINTTASQGLPLQFLAEVTAELDYSFSGSMTVEFQPLSLDQGSTTEPREEVGESLVIDTEVSAGAFELDFGETMVTGAANPITGSDIVADITLQGKIQGEDNWCGDASGMVLSPLMLPLDGSTFGAMRLADRSERPQEFPVDCDGMTVPPS